MNEPKLKGSPMKLTLNIMVAASVLLSVSIPSVYAKPAQQADTPHALETVSSGLSKEVVVGVVGMSQLNRLASKASELLLTTGLTKFLIETGVPADMQSIIDPGKWAARLGFDPRTSDGWRQIGLRGETGVYLAIALVESREPLPLIVFENPDETAFLAFLRTHEPNTRLVPSKIAGWQTLH